MIVGHVALCSVWIGELLGIAAAAIHMGSSNQYVGKKGKFYSFLFCSASIMPVLGF